MSTTDIFAPCDDMDEKHVALIKAVNSAKTEYEHNQAEDYLRGWRAGVNDARGRGYDWTLADLHHEGEDAKRLMCLGVFLDWEEPDPTLEPDYGPTPYCSHCGAKEARFCDCGPISKDD